MSLEEQRKELAEIMKKAKQKNKELKKSFEPIEIHIGFCFKYKGKTFVFKGLKEDQPEFLEMKYDYGLMDLDITKKQIKTIDPTSIKCDRYGNILDESKEIIKDDKGYYKYKEDNMAVDQDGKWVGHLNNIEMTDLELAFYNQAKRIKMNMKYNLLDFEKVIDFLEKVDINNMTLLEAVIINMLTGKTFVKNSWSDEAKSRLQTFIYDRKLITQDGNEVSTKSGSVKIESPERYSLYKGKYISLIDSNNEKVQRLRYLEEEIMPFYNKIKEYEDLKKELNL